MHVKTQFNSNNYALRAQEILIFGSSRKSKNWTYFIFKNKFKNAFKTKVELAE